MAIQIQLRRGTTAQNDAFTGALGELTYDTDKKQLRVHDGSTVGGNAVDNTTRDVTSQVSNATETVAGKTKIATTAIAQAGVNDTDFLTPKKLKDAFKSPLLGLNQGWVDKTASRVANTNYQNNTGKNLYFAGAGANEVIGQVSNDGVKWFNQFSLGKTGVVSSGGVGIVPANWFYRITGTFVSWSEMIDV